MSDRVNLQVCARAQLLKPIVDDLKQTPIP